MTIEINIMHEIVKEYINFIAQKYGTNYCALKEGANKNLFNDELKNKINLSTCFPRSFQESYTIFDNILSNNIILTTFNNKKIIRVLDIGSGTGGDIFGFIEVFEKYFEGKKVIFYPIEGNDIAKKSFLKIFFKLLKRKNTKNIYEIVKTPIKIINEKNSNQFVEYVKGNISTKLFDIILSFKFVSETVEETNIGNNLSYYDYMVSSNRLIKKNGIVLIADATNQNNGNYNSMILLKDLKKYKKSIYNSDVNSFALLPILPRPCSRLDNNYVLYRYNKEIYKSESRDIYCNSNSTINCFLQHEFVNINNNDGNEFNDKERLCWVLLCSGILGETLSANYMEDDINNKYIIGQRGCEKNTCNLINDNANNEKSALFL